MSSCSDIQRVIQTKHDCVGTALTLMQTKWGKTTRPLKGECGWPPLKCEYAVRDIYCVALMHFKTGSLSLGPIAEPPLSLNKSAIKKPMWPGFTPRRIWRLCHCFGNGDRSMKASLHNCWERGEPPPPQKVEETSFVVTLFGIATVTPFPCQDVTRRLWDFFNLWPTTSGFAKTFYRLQTAMNNCKTSSYLLENLFPIYTYELATGAL